MTCAMRQRFPYLFIICSDTHHLLLIFSLNLITFNIPTYTSCLCFLISSKVTLLRMVVFVFSVQKLSRPQKFMAKVILFLTHHIKQHNAWSLWIISYFATSVTAIKNGLTLEPHIIAWVHEWPPSEMQSTSDNAWFELDNIILSTQLTISQLVSTHSAMKRHTHFPGREILWCL